MNGLVQIGTPTRIRSSTAMPTAETRARTTIEAENQTSGRCSRGVVTDGVGGFDEDIRIPPWESMDSGTRRYLIAPLSMMGVSVGKGRRKTGKVNTRCASES
ncbi:hypothetical protein GCM10010222_52730 [Streptomyces tanashiensis]|nr:hypothetical protein GCM10010222_52730 [Streptomyces tanashiensis]